MNPNFTGVWIPKEVFQNQNLSPNAKIIYGIIDSLDNEEGCFASNGYLATALSLGERSVRLLIAELESQNLIHRSENNGNRIIRTVEKVALVEAIKGGKNFPTERKKITAGGGKKLPTYNKENNKVDINTIPWSEPLPFSSEEFSKVWQMWLDYRKESKKPLKPSTVNAQFNQFIKWGEEKSIASIQESIKNGWQGLFEPRKQIGVYKAKPLTNQDHTEF